MRLTRERPNYDYGANGLVIDVRTLDPSLSEPTRTINVPTIDRSHESWMRTHEALEEGPRREGRIGYTIVPPADEVEADGALAIYHYPWGGYADNPVGINDLASLAAARPNQTIMAIDSPAVGRSRRLPSAISREIARSGSYVSYGELAVNALSGVISDYDRYVVTGASQGARRAIGLAAMMGMQYGTQIAELHMLDPVGSHWQSMADLADAFSRREAKHTAEYVKASPDKLAARDQEGLATPSNAFRALGHFVVRGGFINQMIREPQAMAKDGLYGDLKSAAPHVTGHVTVSSPELSKLTNYDDHWRILKDTFSAKSSPDDTYPLVQQRILRGQTHALAAGNPGVLGVVLSSELEVD